MSKHPLADSYVGARWYTPTQGRTIRVLVIHTMEAPEYVTTAEAVAGYFRTLPATNKASAHFCVDNDTIVQCVDVRDVAYAAPGNNHDGIQIELAGTAHQTPAQWGDPYSLAVLDRAAKLAAQLCKEWGIPVKHLTDAQLAQGQKGIVGHVQVSNVYRKSSHWDPGNNFPWERFIQLVQFHSGTATVPALPKVKAPWTFREANHGVFARGSLNHAAVIRRITETMNRNGHQAPWIATVNGKEIGRGRLWPGTPFKALVSSHLQAGYRVNLNGHNKPNNRQALVSVAKEKD